jgi:hypothetical protein
MPSTDVIGNRRRQKEYRARHPERIADKLRNYRVENKERLNQYVKDYRSERRAIVDAAKDVPCMDCKQKFPSFVMDFDHRDPSIKLFGVGKNMGRSVATLLAEIAKCDVVCANCHRIRTHGESNDN